MRVFGVCNHCPDYMFVWLKKTLCIDQDSILILPEQAFLPKRLKSNIRVIMFLSNRSFRRNLDKLNSDRYKKVTGILFASPLDINEYNNIVPLDFEESNDIHLDAFMLKSIQGSEFQLDSDLTVVSKRKVDYLNIVMEHIKSFGSLLNPLMSFIYTLPNGTHQKPLKEIVCSWIYNNDTVKSLERTLKSKENSMPLSAKQKQRIIELMSSDIANKYKNAIVAYRASEVKDEDLLKRLVSEYEVSAYELRYIISIINQ